MFLLHLIGLYKTLFFDVFFIFFCWREFDILNGFLEQIYA